MSTRIAQICHALRCWLASALLAVLHMGVSRKAASIARRKLLCWGVGLMTRSCPISRWLAALPFRQVVGAAVATVALTSVATILAKPASAPNRLAGLREVARAIESIPRLTPVARHILRDSAAAVLREYGPMSAAKRLVVYQQTRQYLSGQAPQFLGGGDEGYRLLGRVFRWAFTNYVRRPDVSAADRVAAATFFRRLKRVERTVILRTYKDTPRRLRLRLADMVARKLKLLQQSWPDYYSFALYPREPVLTASEMYAHLSSRRWAAGNGHAFAAFGGPLIKAQNKTLKQRDRSTFSMFLHLQFWSQSSTLKFFLIQHFFVDKPGSPFVYRNMPKSLFFAIRRFRAKVGARAEIKWKELTDPAYHADLYPTGTSILKGSGIHSY
jgi:hypothetical protein